MPGIATTSVRKGINRAAHFVRPQKYSHVHWLWKKFGNGLYLIIRHGEAVPMEFIERIEEVCDTYELPTAVMP